MDLKKISELRKKHPKLFVSGVILLSLFIISFIGDLLPDTKADDQKQITENTLTIEQQIKQDVQKIVGSEEIKDFTYFEDTGQVIISYDASDYSSAITLQYDHIQIYEKLFQNYNLKEVSIFSWMTFVDTYGQETDMVGIRSMMTKETANKINWGSIITSNLPMVADTYYLHPALEE